MLCAVLQQRAVQLMLTGTYCKWPPVVLHSNLQCNGRTHASMELGRCWVCWRSITLMWGLSHTAMQLCVCAWGAATVSCAAHVHGHMQLAYTHCPSCTNCVIPHAAVGAAVPVLLLWSLLLLPLCRTPTLKTP